MPRCLSASWMVLLTFAASGCEGGLDGAAWDLPEARVIREVSAGEGLRMLEDAETILVQVREPSRPTNRVAGTQIVSARDPLPTQVTESSATVVILAEDAAEGIRVAARLARAGIQDVAIVRGGVAAWEAARRPVDPDSEDGSETGAAEST